MLINKEEKINKKCPICGDVNQTLDCLQHLDDLELCNKCIGNYIGLLKEKDHYLSFKDIPIYEVMIENTDFLLKKYKQYNIPVIVIEECIICNKRYSLNIKDWVCNYICTTCQNKKEENINKNLKKIGYSEKDKLIIKKYVDEQITEQKGKFKMKKVVIKSKSKEVNIEKFDVNKIYAFQSTYSGIIYKLNKSNGEYNFIIVQKSIGVYGDGCKTGIDALRYLINNYEVVYEFDNFKDFSQWCNKQSTEMEW